MPPSSNRNRNRRSNWVPLIIPVAGVASGMIAVGTMPGGIGNGELSLAVPVYGSLAVLVVSLPMMWWDRIRQQRERDRQERERRTEGDSKSSMRRNHPVSPSASAPRPTP